MKIAFVTTYNARDIKSWSGTPYYMAKAFAKSGIEVEYIGGLKSLNPHPFSFKIRNRISNQFLKKKFGTYQNYYEPANLRYFANQVQERLKQSNADVVFSPGAIPIAYLNTNKPVVMWTDATFAVLYNYYFELSNFNKRSIRNCNLYEKEVLKRVSFAIFSSEWAARSAIEHYGADPDKVKVVPYGANIQCNRLIQDIEEINKTKSRNICKLLFIGQDWERKGGENAIKIAEELNKKNIKTELTIVGCVPPNTSTLPDFVKVFGFVDKSEKEGSDLIEELYCTSHFFVLPTTAECTPIVFSEANSFGLPVITIDTGGVSSIIKDNVNGKMFDIHLDVEQCAVYIRDIFCNSDRYNSISLSSFKEYSTRLNWEVSVSKVISYLKRL